MKNISEVNYLNLSKTPIYRRIMRTFYEERENLKYNLYREEIFEKIREYPELSEYKEAKDIDEELKFLVENGNLTAVQSPKRVQTIAEYKNRDFIYSMTEVAVLVERMTITLENLEFQSKSISTNFLTRIELELEKIRREDYKNWNLSEYNDWWKDLQENFKKLNESYQDYLHEFYGEKAQKFMKTLEFIQYKDRLMNILKEFVRELQLKRNRLKKILDEINKNIESEVLELVWKSEIDQQSLNINSFYENREKHNEMVRENIFKKWRTFKNWFEFGGNKQSEYESLLKITGDIIEKIVKNAYYMLQRKNSVMGKKDTYKLYIKKFLLSENIEEAHKLSTEIFGIQNIRHYTFVEKSIDSINKSVFEDSAKEYKLESRNRSYKPKIQKGILEDKKALKKAYKEEYAQKLQENRKTIIRFTKDGILDISKIEECISSEFRIFILNLITMSSINGNNGMTELGQKYVVEKLEKRCILHCEDGDLEMPTYIFKFLEE